VKHVHALLALILAAGLLAGAVRVPAAGADDSTPTAVVAPETAIPTVATEVAEPSPTTITRIVQERSPVVQSTAVIVPSVAPLPSATGSSGVDNLGTVPAPYVPPPSPEQLRESARLRWGNHVPDDVRRWAFLIVPISNHYGIDPNLVAAVMTMESGGDPSALSPADARGLMQVLHGPWDPRQNITVGVRMLAAFLDEFHDLDLALAAYNAGPAAVSAYNGVPPYRETQDYVIIVHYLYDLFGHRSLSAHRREQYRSTLKDLARFKRERKKIPFLSKVAGARTHLELTCSSFGDSCFSKTHATLFPTLDPFWPIPGLPDPLHRVGPTLASQ
jgi:hypothetical protein